MTPSDPHIPDSHESVQERIVEGNPESNVDRDAFRVPGGADGTPPMPIDLSSTEWNTAMMCYLDDIDQMYEEFDWKSDCIHIQQPRMTQDTAISGQHFDDHPCMSSGASMPYAGDHIEGFPPRSCAGGPSGKRSRQDPSLPDTKDRQERIERNMSERSLYSVETVDEECEDKSNLERREKKKTREKRRRLEVNVKFDRLVEVLTQNSDAHKVELTERNSNRIEILENAISAIEALSRTIRSQEKEIDTLRKAVKDHGDGTEAQDSNGGPATTEIDQTQASQTLERNEQILNAQQQLLRASLRAQTQGGQGQYPFLIAFPLWMQKTDPHGQPPVVPRPVISQQIAEELASQAEEDVTSHAPCA